MTPNQELRARALELSIMRCNVARDIRSSIVYAEYLLRFLQGENGVKLDREIDALPDAFYNSQKEDEYE